MATEPSDGDQAIRQPEMKDSEMSEEERSMHLGFMREAVAMGELAIASDETPVGCVFVHGGNIIARGMNATNRTMNGTRHAEYMAISDILSMTIDTAPNNNPTTNSSEEKTTNSSVTNNLTNMDPPTEARKKKYSPEILKECDLYVTVEPCIMCASLLRQFGIRKVYYGATNEKFGGTGGVLNIHRGNGGPDPDAEKEEGSERDDDYEVSGGWMREEAILLLRRFYVQENGRAPEPKKRKDRTVKLEIDPAPPPSKKS